MTYAIIWLAEAMAAYRRLRSADPDGAKLVAAAVRALADEAAPPGSTALGGTAFRRLRLGDYRILYEVDGAAGSVSVMHIGRLPLGRR